MDIVSLRRTTGWQLTVLVLLFSLPVGAVVADDAIPTSIGIEVPDSISDLRELQERFERVAEQVLPSTVAVQVGSAHGSGVIISPDGYVLTAAHVVGAPDRRARLTLGDGRLVRGVTLGVYRTMDAGLIQITTPLREGESQWPHAPWGDSQGVVAGQWCMAAGHPGGYQPGRPAVVRVGRVLSVRPEAFNTDCTLIGGDSGGPLFDLSGSVIGVHSRIGGPLTVNLHVPVNAYRDSWDRLAAGEAWGRLPGSEPFIGVQGEADSQIARITQVFSDSPAQRAGIQIGDVIVAFGGRQVTDFHSLQRLVEKEAPGTTVRVEVLRGETHLLLDLEIGERRG